MAMQKNGLDDENIFLTSGLTPSYFTPINYMAFVMKPNIYS